MQFKIQLLSLLLALSLGCAVVKEESSSAGPGGSASAKGISLQKVEARLVPGGASGAVYLKIVNSNAQPDRLRWVESGAAQDVQTHESREEGGMVRMLAHPDGFEIPSNATVELKPGGKHIMLLGIEDPPEPGGKIPLKLHFDKAGSIEVDATVVEIG